MQISTPKKKRARRRGRGKSPAGGGPVFAAIDLGTNNCRLLDRQGLGGRGLARDRFLFAHVRLGEGLAATGTLSSEAIERTVAALKICAEHLRRQRVDHMRAIATEACRRAANASVLVERVARRGRHRTRHRHIGRGSAPCRARLRAADRAALRRRAGVRYRRRLDRTDLDAARRATPSKHVFHLAGNRRGDAGRKRWARPSVQAIYVASRRCARFAGRDGRARAPIRLTDQHHLLGTSGTVTTLAGIALGLPRYERARVDASWHRLRRHSARSWTGSWSSTAPAAPPSACVGRGARRSDAARLRHLRRHPCATGPARELRVADRGLRDGMLRELMAKAATRHDRSRRFGARRNPRARVKKHEAADARPPRAGSSASSTIPMCMRPRRKAIAAARPSSSSSWTRNSTS